MGGVPEGELVDLSVNSFPPPDYQDWPDGVLKRAVTGFYQNGGADLFVLNIGPDVDVITDQVLLPLTQVDHPNLVAAPGYVDAASHKALIAHCEGRSNRFAVLDGPAEIADASALQKEPLAASGKAALYLPWVVPKDTQGTLFDPTPPSGHICGAIARTDQQRGVWQAPANVGLWGVGAVTQDLTDEDQEGLNAANVNAIREIEGRGVRIWGARTRAPEGHEMRYISERRLMCMLEQSLKRGLDWVVFDPNGAALWVDVRQQVDTFMNALWRSGALVGETVEQSFFVRCGHETMSQADLDQGRLICEVGISMLRPAEFSMLRLEFQTAIE